MFGEDKMSEASRGSLSSGAHWTQAEKALRSQFLFGTTSGDEFRERVIPKGGEAENMQDVFLMGQRDGKYMKYMGLKQPGWGRKNTKYAQDFGPKPLTQFELNKAMGSFGPPPSPRKPPLGPFGTTTYDDEFCGFDNKKMKGARQEQDRGGSKRRPFCELSEGLLRGTSTTEENFVRRTGPPVKFTEKFFLESLRARPDGLFETYPLPLTTQYADDFGIPRCGSNTASTVGSSRYAPSLRSASQGSRSVPSLRSGSRLSGSQHASSKHSRASGSKRAMSESEWSRQLGVHDITQVATAPGA